MPPTLSTLYRYPVKSLRGESLAASPVGPQGVWLDRTWMVADANGRLVTGRDYPELVRVTATPAEGGVWLRATGQPALWVVRLVGAEPVGTVDLIHVAVHGYRNDEVLVSGPPAGELVVTAGVQKMAPGPRVALPEAARNAEAQEAAR